MSHIEMMAIKIHYDNRNDLPPYLKYSRLPTKKEYQSYLQRYEETGSGGDGFHEGLNFHPENDEVKFYLPPTCIPGKAKINSEFIVFSFSYSDPGKIIGVHAGARILGGEGIARGESVGLDGVGDFTYHGISPRMLTTIFTTPIKYNIRDDRFLPVLEKWCFGKRYLEKKHAINILKTAYANVLENLENNTPINLAEKEVAIHEILVIKNILFRYFHIDMESIELQAGVNTDSLVDTHCQEADRDIGEKGEKYIYEKEIEYMENNNLPTSLVEWLSRMTPTAVFDIQTARLINGKVQEHYLEIKSSKYGYGENVYLSDRQIRFFEKHKECSHIVFVNFNGDEPKEIYKTYNELNKEFYLSPIKYKLRPK
ncbi:DUF3883 domain-containing protein [Providencia vermicola]|uniref:protein NO VEIN domain-containing protein n=1 Tax=Providencia TaxID=586 RepID=UPI0032DA23E2